MQPERLPLIEDIWCLITLDNSGIILSKWKKKELDSRYKEYKKGDLKLHSWEDVHRELRANYR